MTSEGEAVLVYKITNTVGASVELCNIGASIIAINVPDSEGNMTDVALGYKEWQSYLQDPAAMCKSVGRYANRIAGGRFELNGKEFILARNNGPNHLHGGVDGFGTRELFFDQSYLDSCKYKCRKCNLHCLRVG